MRRRFVCWLPVVGLAAEVMCAVAAATAAQGPAPAAQAPAKDVIAEVRAAIARQDFDAGEAILRAYRQEQGTTSQALAALSWLGRGALAAKKFDRAAAYAEETYELAVAAVGHDVSRLDKDSNLEIALGAAIEVQAQTRAARGARSDAVYFLSRELETYGGTVLHKRIQKNINLLSLAGRPAPSLEATEQLGGPLPPDRLKGKVVLLFFWAHWCPDCKTQAPILQALLDKYRAAGLAVVAPTQRYGYISRRTGAAPPDDELRHMAQVRDTHYAFLSADPIPVSEAIHKRYGVSTTPTLALVDRQGMVRLYHPGTLTEAALEREIVPLLKAPGTQ
jgi:thiol-disulfide isomerase/thioredoxin